MHPCSPFAAPRGGFEAAFCCRRLWLACPERGELSCWAPHTAPFMSWGPGRGGVTSKLPAHLLAEQLVGAAKLQQTCRFPSC